MVDEFPYQKRTFISKLNPETPPFQPSSSSYQHIQEISPLKLISENNNNHLHIEPIINNHHQNEENYYSTTIHSIEPSENISSQRNYIQEIIPNNQQAITSSHIESVNDEISFEKFDEDKTQRELDENEIPIESNTSSNEFQLNPLPDVVAETLEQKSDNSVHQPDDILGNKSLLKQTITPGILDTRPIRNSLATVSYKLFLIDSSTLNSRLIETITNESFFVGEYDILSAIDIAIQLMDRGEHAIIDSDIRHCYGEQGCEEKQIPSNNSYQMKIDLEFHDWKHSSDIQILPFNERLSWGDKKRQRGNFFYRRKEYSTALQCYQNALKFLDTTEYPLIEEDNQSSILINRYIQVQNNLAQVYLLNNQYEQCLNAVNNVLQYDKNNIKGLFRQGKVLIELGNYDQAIRPLKLLLENSNKDIEKEKIQEMLNFCQTKLAKYEKNEKEIYKRMFQSKTTSNENFQKTKIIKKKIENKNTNWWTYIAMGSAVLAAVGLAAIIKYR